jgi:hypothetical protein
MDGYLEQFIFRTARKLTEESELEDKEKFFNDVMGTYEAAPKYDAKIILGDFDAKVGKGDKIIDAAGKYTLHASTNANGNRRLISSNVPII